MYRHLGEAWKQPAKSYIQGLMRVRAISWRRQPSVTRVEKPTRLDRAHRLGYKGKTGFVVVRVRIRRGGGGKLRPTMGRRQKKMGVSKITRTKSIRLIAEQRAAKQYPNLEVLNSYWVWQDGVHKWYEILLVDPASPHIKSDKDINWIVKK